MGGREVKSGLEVKVQGLVQVRGWGFVLSLGVLSQDQLGVKVRGYRIKVGCYLGFERFFVWGQNLGLDVIGNRDQGVRIGFLGYSFCFFVCREYRKEDYEVKLGVNQLDFYIFEAEVRIVVQIIFYNSYRYEGFQGDIAFFRFSSFIIFFRCIRFICFFVVNVFFFNGF